MIANPYAAPQTIHARYYAHDLPLAEARGNEDERRDFREFSTEQLTGFQQKSRAIDKLQIFWLFATVAAIIVGISWLVDHQRKLSEFLPEPLFYAWLAGFFLVVLRFCAGIDRRRWMRPLIVGMDSFLVSLCGFCLCAPGFHNFFLHPEDARISQRFIEQSAYWHGACIVILAGVAYLAIKSAYAAFHAPELFSKHRYGHARLCQELDYRNEYGIE